MKKWVRLKIRRAGLNQINIDFNQQTGKVIAIYLLENGYCPVVDAESIEDEDNIHYLLREIDDTLFGIIEKNRGCFGFSSECIAWLKNPTHDELEEIVPESFPDIQGRNFREYMAVKKVVDGHDYYSCHCLNQKSDELGYYSRYKNPTEEDFWPFYDKFGSERIILNHKMK